MQSHELGLGAVCPSHSRWAAGSDTTDIHKGSQTAILHTFCRGGCCKPVGEAYGDATPLDDLGGPDTRNALCRLLGRGPRLRSCWPPGS